MRVGGRGQGRSEAEGAPTREEGSALQTRLQHQRQPACVRRRKRPLSGAARQLSPTRGEPREADCRTSDVGHWLAMTGVRGAGVVRRNDAVREGWERTFDFGFASAQDDSSAGGAGADSPGRAREVRPRRRRPMVGATGAWGRARIRRRWVPGAAMCAGSSRTPAPTAGTEVVRRNVRCARGWGKILRLRLRLRSG